MDSPSPKNNKEKFSHRGKLASSKRLTHIELPLDNLEIKLAVKLGDGDLTLGIRRAIVFASMHQF